MFLTAIFSLVYLATFCYCKSSDWKVLKGLTTYKNNDFFIKGVSWFGLEDCSHGLHGLDKHPLTWYLDFLQEHKFNVIRVPFSQDWVLHGLATTKPADWITSAEPSLRGRTSLEMLDKLFDEAGERGIFILLDMHRLSCKDQGHELWYSTGDTTYTTETFFRTWNAVMNRYKDHKAFHGADLLNEPRGLANWGNDPSRSWNLFVSYAFTQLPDDVVVYVEGIEWGRSFAGMRDFPITAPEERLVYSPHCYGPSVTNIQDMSVYTLHADWTNVFGYLAADKKCTVIGEFGGRYIGADRNWQDMFVAYLSDLRIPGIYWSLNPDSGDTGGILKNDWTTPEADKLQLLERLQPYPTVTVNITTKHLRSV